MTGAETPSLDPKINRPRRTRLQGALREVLRAPITAKFGILVILVMTLSEATLFKQYLNMILEQVTQFLYSLNRKLHKDRLLMDNK